MHIFQTTAILLQTTATITPLHKTLLPRDVPSITSDPWQCATVNVTQYFDPPKPTGGLLAALLSYADKLYENCTLTFPPTATVIPTCPFPETSEWCAFTKIAAPSITAALWSYGSSASSWWSAKSSGASSVASRCPNTWFKIMNETPGGATWLNDTIIFSECYESAHPPTSRPSTSGSGRSLITSSTGPVLTSSAASSNVMRRTTGSEKLVVAGASLAVAGIIF
ncbi:hypothetical protein B0J11DRAFT_591822 [Dendryphion nanum]|uniref:DUF7735 domain-containing protein n=1 Tax=Dendryphion nanum TaxID=256645 RepID=A0A9P9IF67_9PLEO|nr:hypothetical protein B0J11DRAFT_591822 [Dendryphion nanum]